MDVFPPVSVLNALAVLNTRKAGYLLYHKGRWIDHRTSRYHLWSSWLETDCGKLRWYHWSNSCFLQSGYENKQMQLQRIKILPQKLVWSILYPHLYGVSTFCRQCNIVSFGGKHLNTFNAKKNCTTHRIQYQSEISIKYSMV